MKVKDFEKIVHQRLVHCEKLLCSKGEEYSRCGDRLHNLKAAARMKNTDKFEAIYGMWMKHIVSVHDMIQDARQGILPSRKLIADKLSDNINYNLLLEGLFEEDIRSNLLEGDKLQCELA